MRYLLALPLVALLFSGCTGLDYYAENYEGYELQELKINGSDFIITDNTEDERLAIGPGRAAGFTQGLTFGLAKTPEAIYKEAAISYLASTGRKCTVSNPLLILEPLHEVMYSCQ